MHESCMLLMCAYQKASRPPDACGRSGQPASVAFEWRQAGCGDGYHLCIVITNQEMGCIIWMAFHSHIRQPRQQRKTIETGQQRDLVASVSLWFICANNAPL